MVGAPINLNKARKARDRQAQKAAAASNRVKFGRTKAEANVDKASVDKAWRALDDAKRDH